MLAQVPDKVRPMPITHAIDTLNFLHPDGEVFELCVIGPKTSNSNLWEGRAGGKKPIVAGWFKDPVAAAKLVVQIGAEGIYTTLNRCQEAVLARAHERLKANVPRTADSDIARLTNLLIDLDPKRPTGVSSSEPEHQTALGMAQQIRVALEGEGWPEPLLGDSGNGSHLIFPIDLENTPEHVELLKMVLVALAQRFEKELARAGLDLDLKVFNPARISKLYGTKTGKGDNLPERPHRPAKILELPLERRPVPVDILRKLASTALTGRASSRSGGTDSAAGQDRFDLEAYLQYYGVEVLKVKEHHGGQLHCLAECVFDPGHTSNEAAIGQAADGKLFYQCFHNSCKGRTWADARTIISGSDKLNGFIVGGGSRSRSARPPLDYDQAEREAIQAEALAAVHKKTLVLEKEKTLVLESALSTSVAEALRGAGWAEDKISHVANILVQSEKAHGKFNIAAEVREWVLSTIGDFHSTDVDRELQLSTLSTSREEKKVILGTMSKALERLRKEGVIERVGSRRGQFRRIEKESEIIDFASADCSTIFDIRWPEPFRLERLVNLYPKNIIVVAGATNAGKTALLLNVVRENMARHKVLYFSSEMGAEELRLRLEKFGMPITSWQFDARERAANFADVVIPDAVNIIDYFELAKDFYGVGGEIKKIFDKLTTGIAIIAIQKDENKDFGRGGGFSAEKARLYLSMNSGELKITKGKNWAQPGHNPNGKTFKFKLIDGCKFIEG